MTGRPDIPFLSEKARSRGRFRPASARLAGTIEELVSWIAVSRSPQKFKIPLTVYFNSRIPVGSPPAALDVQKLRRPPLSVPKGVLQQRCRTAAADTGWPRLPAPSNLQLLCIVIAHRLVHGDSCMATCANPRCAYRRMISATRFRFQYLASVRGKGRVPPPSSTEPFLAVGRKYSQQTKDQAGNIGPTQ